MSKYKKNDILDLNITDISDEGLGIGKSDNFVWFVKGAVLGDRVKAHATKVNTHFGYAFCEEITEPSPYREAPLCPMARACGGCNLVGLSYEAELKYKENKVYNLLLRIGGIEQEYLDKVFEPIAYTGERLRYRAKSVFPIARTDDGNIRAGFYALHSHRLVPLDDCPVGIEENSKILNIITSFMKDKHIEPFDEKSGRGLVRHVLIRKGFSTEEILICIVINGEKIVESDELCKRLKDRAPGIKSISININKSKGNAILGEKTVVLYGKPYIEEKISIETVNDANLETEENGGHTLTFRIAPTSFFQVNPGGTALLYSEVLKEANLSGRENVWDLYCGVGSISLFLAKKARRVYGVEIVPAAIENARTNARINNIDNTLFMVGKAEEVLPAWIKEHESEKIDLICVDPPRKGLDKSLIDTIIEAAPDKIIYVSCNPATLARDLKLLIAGGYELKSVRPIDMFPGTVHVETVVLLSRVEKR